MRKRSSDLSEREKTAHRLPRNRGKIFLRPSFEATSPVMDCFCHWDHFRPLIGHYLLGPGCLASSFSSGFLVAVTFSALSRSALSATLRNTFPWASLMNCTSWRMSQYRPWEARARARDVWVGWHVKRHRRNRPLWLCINMIIHAETVGVGAHEQACLLRHRLQLVSGCPLDSVPH